MIVTATVPGTNSVPGSVAYYHSDHLNRNRGLKRNRGQTPIYIDTLPLI